MFLTSTLGYWIILLTYMTLIVILLNNDSKRKIYIEQHIEEYFFNKIDTKTNYTYNGFRSTVYVFLFFIGLVPILNVTGTVYLVWMLLKKD